MKNKLSAANYLAQLFQLVIRLCDVVLVVLIAQALFYTQNGVVLQSHYYLLIVITVICKQIVFTEFRVYFNLFEDRLKNYL